jgi:hypothetical protein
MPLVTKKKLKNKKCTKWLSNFQNAKQCFLAFLLHSSVIATMRFRYEFRIAKLPAYKSANREMCVSRLVESAHGVDVDLGRKEQIIINYTSLFFKNGNDDALNCIEKARFVSSNKHNTNGRYLTIEIRIATRKLLRLTEQISILHRTCSIRNVNWMLAYLYDCRPRLCA